MAIKIVQLPEGNFVEFPGGFRVPEAHWSTVKQELKSFLVEKKELFAKPPEPPPIAVPQEQDAPCLTQLAGGLNFNNHADQEVEAWNKRLAPGKGGGVRISTDHAEIQSTIAGNVLVRSSSLVDFSTLLASAVRSSEPLDGKVVKLNAIILVEVKDAPGE